MGDNGVARAPEPAVRDSPAAAGWVARARPRLRADVRPLRRTDGGLQLGTAPGRGVVLDGLDDAAVDLVRRLDGADDLAAGDARGGRAEAGIADTILGVLTRVDALAPVRARRLAPARVVVDGGGRLPDLVADLLRRAGHRLVSSGPYAGDAAAGPPAGPARMDRADLPDLVVLTADGVVARDRAQPWQRRRVRHLPVTVDGSSAVVGPLVHPGRSPCLACLDLARTDRDPSWPVLSAQIVGPRVGPPARVGDDSPLTALTAAMAAMVVLAELDGGAPAGVGFDVSMPWPRVAQRRWSAHPRCTCGASTRHT